MPLATVGSSQDAPIAVVGAGMAGLSLAHALLQAGRQVIVFEENALTGGRLVAPPGAEAGIDWGTQFFTVRNAAFKMFINKHCPDAVGAWNADIQYRSVDGLWMRSRGDTRYVGLPSMNALGQAISADLDIRRDCQVTRLCRGRDGLWMVLDVTGSRHEGFAAVALAMPPGNAWRLCVNSGLKEAAAKLWPAASTVGPCRAVAVRFAGLSELPCQGYQMADGALQWAGNNSSKPGRSIEGEQWVLHGSTAWSRKTKGLPQEEAQARLLDEFREISGHEEQPQAISSVYWPHAKSMRTAREKHMFWPGDAIGVCGDWLGGGRLESAFESGQSLAAAMRG